MFDRAAAFGMRLAIPKAAAIRFEPGGEKEVTLVPFVGKQHVYGFSNLVNGWTGGAPTTYRPNHAAALKRALELGFKSSKKRRRPPAA